jgi:hypothetical protein
MPEKNETKIHDVTPEQFKRFGRFCRAWLKYLGLGDWRVMVQHTGTSDDSQYMAEMSCGILSRTATIRLCKTTTWEEKSFDKKLPGTALHEVLELLLADLADVVKWNLIDRERNDFIEREKHAIINRLVPMLLEIESEGGSTEYDDE